jgi:hypothetical protein
LIAYVRLGLVFGPALSMHDHISVWLIYVEYLKAQGVWSPVFKLIYLSLRCLVTDDPNADEWRGAFWSKSLFLENILGRFHH